jgi:hypothetical protein
MVLPFINKMVLSRTIDIVVINTMVLPFINRMVRDATGIVTTLKFFRGVTHPTASYQTLSKTKKTFAVVMYNRDSL